MNCFGVRKFTKSILDSQELMKMLTTILFYLILIAVGFIIGVIGLVDNDKPGIFIIFSIIGIVIGFLAHSIVLCTVIGMTVGLIIAKVCEKVEYVNWINNYHREQEEKTNRYVVRNAVNQTLNRNISSYLKSGYVNDDYYSYSYVSDYSKKLNQGFEDFISEYKYRLLEQAKSSKDFKIYQIESGKYAEAYLGYLFYNEVTDEEYFKFPYACLNPYNHTTHFLRIFQHYGLVLREKEKMTVDGRLDIAYDVYAYVKL